MPLLAGGGYGATLLQDLSTSDLREFMNVNFESNFCKTIRSITELDNR